MPPTDLVTGAFGFTGSRIAELLVAAGRAVRTFTRRAATGHPLAGQVTAETPAWDDADVLRRQLAGVETVYITYWMRFPRGDATWEEMVGNVGRLVSAARAAGVRQLVYLSVTNAAPDSSTAYFRAKAQAEDLIRAGGVPYAIVRPTLLFGEGDILINNMAWTLRRLPLFGVAGDGRYRVQPVYVGDVARLCVEMGRGEPARSVDAAGPETFAFDELVRLVARAVRRRARLLHLPPALVLSSATLLGLAVRDVVLTRDEIRELMEGLLTSAADPLCPTRFSEWVVAHGHEIGRRWSSEIERNFEFDRAAT